MLVPWIMRSSALSKLLLLGLGGGAAAYVFSRLRRYQLAPEVGPPGRYDALHDPDDRDLAHADDRVLDDSTDDRDAVALSDPTARDRAPVSIPNSFDVDPRDAVQRIDEVNEFHVEDLGVDAVTGADLESDLEMAQLESSLEEAALEEDLETPEDTTLDAIEASAHDVGDLYGVHTPPATDRTHPDGDASFEEGQNWLEALETDAVEKGPEAEHDLADVVDDEDVYDAPHPSDTKDTPVADRGSGGPGGI